MGKNSKLIEVVFKGERRAIYRNRGELDIQEGQWVIVEAERGQELGRVSCVGSLVKLKKGKGETRSIIRISEEADLAQVEKNKAREKEAFTQCKTRIRYYNLDMKLVDVEMQFDGSKITFFFTAAQRIDFRELVKELAATYRTRIELRQIGVRDEAKRVSGYGICGRKQCCCAFLNEFEQITTTMAKDQQLSLNPTKISGNCGRLLCCLRYELDEYTEVYKNFPPLNSIIKVKEKEGEITSINVNNNTGLVRFRDGTQEWLTIDDFKSAVIISENKPADCGKNHDCKGHGRDCKHDDRKSGGQKPIASKPVEAPQAASKPEEPAAPQIKSEAANNSEPQSQEPAPAPVE